MPALNGYELPEAVVAAFEEMIDAAEGEILLLYVATHPQQFKGFRPTRENLPTFKKRLRKRVRNGVHLGEELSGVLAVCSLTAEMIDHRFLRPGGRWHRLLRQLEGVLAQGGQARLVLVAEAELVGVGPALIGDGGRLAAPDQLGTACAEPPPPAEQDVGGPAVGARIPAFHRMDAPAVAERAAAEG